jgi:hypothetical protein
MTDIDAKKRQILTSFGVYQMNKNPGGIGNECTHWIYAALFEARALDHDRALHIAQNLPPYTWGRPVDASAVQRGDIAQFHDFKTEFFVFVQNASSSRWAEATKIRGPNHTGMVFTVPRSGMYYQLESHLHQPGYAVMSVRGNTVFFESFAIAVPMQDFAKLQGNKSWPADVDIAQLDDLLERVDWADLRGRFTVPLTWADSSIKGIKHKKTPVLDGGDVGMFCRVKVSGKLRFFCPQASNDRLQMSDDQLAAEKAKLIARMIRGGRKGHGATEDEYSGDNKQQRVKDHRFDWTFVQAAPGP